MSQVDQVGHFSPSASHKSYVTYRVLKLNTFKRSTEYQYKIILVSCLLLKRSAVGKAR